MLIDEFFLDVDHSLRELGISDVGVPKRMKKLAGMFYGRLEAYSKAMDAGDAAALSVALQRNIYPEAAEPADMSGLAQWMVAAEVHLSAIPEEAIATGSATIPGVA